MGSSPRVPGVPNPTECPTPESGWITQRQSVRGVPSPTVSWSAQPLEVPIPESPWSAQPRSVSGVPSPRVSLECPTPSLPGLSNPRVSSGPECPWSRVSLPREGGDVRSEFFAVVQNLSFRVYQRTFRERTLSVADWARLITLPFLPRETAEEPPKKAAARPTASRPPATGSVPKPVAEARRRSLAVQWSRVAVVVAVTTVWHSLRVWAGGRALRG